MIVWTCYDFGETLETYGGFLGLRGGKYCYLVLHILLEDTLYLVGLGHGGLGNLWRFHGLGICFLVGWEVNSVGSARRSVSWSYKTKVSSSTTGTGIFPWTTLVKLISMECSS